MDGLGGFASGTVSLERTRRYHALLLTATTPPTGRVALVNGLEVAVETPAGPFGLSTQRYVPDVLHPDATPYLHDFAREPWPTWTFRLPDGTVIEHDLFAVHGTPEVVARWRTASASGLRLTVRPLLSGRDYHALQRENGAADLEPRRAGEDLVWRTYPGSPEIALRTNGVYRHAPVWYRQFLYREEEARGLDAVEDLSAPGELGFDLSSGPAVVVLRAGRFPDATPATDHAARRAAAEATRRARFPTPRHRAADAYVVRRGAGHTIIAGYPWFTDWGRDTFIALRGLCLATDQHEVAEDILVSWAGTVSEGMLPNLFPDGAAAPEYNTVDAALWYVIAAHELLELSGARLGRFAREAILGAIEAILAGHARGTRFGIRLDDDGLIAAGVPGAQLTWMDAKIGDRVVTPRIGKPVEIQALWINALEVGARSNQAWRATLARARDAFAARFWNADAGALHDVVDADHVPGRVDSSFRPNQIFAAGGLPFPVLGPARAAQVVAAVEARLLTPLGLRTLAPGQPGYCPRYEGGVVARDSAYHQGTVWPWLIGPFVQAWVRARGSTASARREAEARFLPPLRAHLEVAGLGHVSEIADAEPPHTPRGCPFQAWSLGELLRIERWLGESAETT